MLSSFLISSALSGPTPFKYSIGLDNMLLVDEIGYCFYKYISFEVERNLCDAECLELKYRPYGTCIRIDLGYYRYYVRLDNYNTRHKKSR
jgi:hypothetical protein